MSKPFGLNEEDHCTCNFIPDKPCPYHEPQEAPPKSLDTPTIDEPRRVCDDCHKAIRLHDKYTKSEYTVSGITIKTYKHLDCSSPESYPMTPPKTPSTTSKPVEGYFKATLDYAPKTNGKKFAKWCEDHGFTPLNGGRRAWSGSLQTYLRSADGVAYIDGEPFLFDEDDLVDLDKQVLEGRIEEYQLGLLTGAMPELIGKPMAEEHLAELKALQTNNKEKKT